MHIYLKICICICICLYAYLRCISLSCCTELHYSHQLSPSGPARSVATPRAVAEEARAASEPVLEAFVQVLAARLEEMPEETVLHILQFPPFFYFLLRLPIYLHRPYFHPHHLHHRLLHEFLVPQQFRPPAWQEPFRPCQIQQGSRAVFQVIGIFVFCLSDILNFV